MRYRVFGVAALGLAAVSGCVMVQDEPLGPIVTEDGSLETPEESIARRRAALPAEVQTALPTEMDPGFLLQDDSGCWTLVLEQSEPLTGVPLRDAFGQQVCSA